MQTAVKMALAELLVLLLWSCTSTTEIQLYTEFLEPGQAEALVHQLEGKHYRVKLNSQPVPAGLRYSTLIYSPLHRDIEQVNQLLEILATTTFGTPQLALTGKENHFYTRKTVGLYLLPDNIVEQRRLSRPQKYSHEYNGVCDSGDASLVLAENGGLSFTTYDWNEELDRDLTTTRTGNWHVTGTTLYMSLEGLGDVEFSAVRKVVEGERNYREYRLVNNNTEPFYDNCRFFYRELLF